jgi:tRNA U34 5-carboxymethylaminomethyl modifying GTPase MnmE/TrmE
LLEFDSHGSPYVVTRLKTLVLHKANVIRLTAAIPIAAAGIFAAGAYLNAKYHIAKDVKAIYDAKKAQRNFNSASKSQKRGEIYIKSPSR